MEQKPQTEQQPEALLGWPAGVLFGLSRLVKQAFPQAVRAFPDTRRGGKKSQLLKRPLSATKEAWRGGGERASRRGWIPKPPESPTFPHIPRAESKTAMELAAERLANGLLFILAWLSLRSLRALYGSAVHDVFLGRCWAALGPQHNPIHTAYTPPPAGLLSAPHVLLPASDWGLH